MQLREQRPMSALVVVHSDLGPWQGQAELQLVAQSYFFSSVAQFVEDNKKTSKTQKVIDTTNKTTERQTQQRPVSKKKRQREAKSRRTTAKSIDDFCKKPSTSLKKCSSRDILKQHRIIPSTDIAFLQKHRQQTEKTTERLDSQNHIIYQKLFQTKQAPPRIPTAKRKFLAQDSQFALTKKSISSCQYFNKLNDRLSKKTKFQNE